MAFSIGLNVDSNLTSHDWDAEEGRRTWWMIYIQEVELSVDSGRPMSISKSDIVVDLPTEDVVVGTAVTLPISLFCDKQTNCASLAQISHNDRWLSS